MLRQKGRQTVGPEIAWKVQGVDPGACVLSMRSMHGGFISIIVLCHATCHLGLRTLFYASYVFYVVEV